jgi:hypothetical protein
MESAAPLSSRSSCRGRWGSSIERLKRAAALPLAPRPPGVAAGRLREQPCCCEMVSKTQQAGGFPAKHERGPRCRWELQGSFAASRSRAAWIQWMWMGRRPISPIVQSKMTRRRGLAASLLASAWAGLAKHSRPGQSKQPTPGRLAESAVSTRIRSFSISIPVTARADYIKIAKALTCWGQK